MDKPYVPKSKPDAYLETDKSYFLECLEDNMTYWTLRKTIRKYITFAEMEIWQKHKPGQDHPEVLLICESEKLEMSVRKLVARELDKTYVELDIKVMHNIVAPM